MYGWPEDIEAKIVQHGGELYVCPAVIGVLDTAELAVHLRVGQLYESMNRFSLQKRPHVAVACTSVSPKAKEVAAKLGVKVILV